MVRSPLSVSKNLNKGRWTPEEDQKLIDYMSQLREKEPWPSIAKNAGLNRPGTNCRLRYKYHLDPDIKRGNFSEDEVRKIIELQSELGNKWSMIAAKLPGRTDNEIKNYWNTNLKKRLHPTTHMPRADPNDLMNLPLLPGAPANVRNLMTPWENGLGLQADPSHHPAVICQQLQHHIQSTAILINQIQAHFINPMENIGSEGGLSREVNLSVNPAKNLLISHLNSGIFLPQCPSISQEIVNSRTTIRSEGGLSTEVNLSVNPAENPLLPPLNSGIFLLQNPSISHEIANSRINIGSEGGLNREVNLSVNPTENLLMSHLNSGIFLPQDPSISVKIANSRTNIGSEGGLRAEVNYLSENPLMPDQLVSVAPSLDHPNQNYLGTPMDDDWEKIFYKTPSPPLLPSSE